MPKMLNVRERELRAEGFRPWGLVIPCSPKIDPPGARLHQYRKGRQEHYLVVSRSRVVLREMRA